MILLDTHVVLWLAFAPGNLSERAASTVAESRRRGDGLAITGTTLWELGMMFLQDRIRPAIPLESFLREIEANFVVLSIDAAIAARALAFTEAYPSDPADKLIGATALVHGISLVTADIGILHSGEVPCIW